jgi:xylitol oxidase
MLQHGSQESPGTNWAGNHRYQAERYAEPRSVEELAELVTGARSVRMLGTRHSFNDIADSDGLLVSTLSLPQSVDVDEAARTVTVSGGARYGELAGVLQDAGWALHNLASLPHISVAGAIATATHGSGVRNGNLSSAVCALSLLKADGKIIRLQEGDDDFPGAVVSLGALGAVLDVTLRIQPAYDMRQRVFSHLPWSAAIDRFDEVMAAGYSVSLFTLWDEPDIAQVWVKERLDEPTTDGEDFFGAAALDHQVHMITGMDVRNTTAQRGVPGPWGDLLPHFRLEFTPSAGAEIQSEYLVPRARAAEAIDAIRPLAPRLRDVLQVTEIRTIARDSLWLSTASDEDVMGLHFTWRREQNRVEELLQDIEAVLWPLGARPHWGKLFLDRDNAVPGRYARLADFRSLAERLDPEHTFRNRFVRRLLG